MLPSQVFVHAFITKEVIWMMRNIQSAIAVAMGVLIACAAGAAQPASPGYSHAELKKMISEARTAEQYKTLASYFRAQENSYEQKAAEEKQEWQRRSQINAALYQKYPRPADSSKNRYEYFAYEAQQSNAEASHYENLAASTPQ
jgi:hypothetical protein